MARQAALKEAADGRKKKRAEKARRKHQKEQDITRCVRAGENRSDVEAELESEDPTEMGDDVISSEDEGGREVVATSVEHCEPVATSTSGGCDAERHGNVPAPRKCATSSDTVGEREAKQTWSPRPLDSSLAMSPPAVGMVVQARWLEERARTRASLGPAPVCDPQWEDAPLAAPVGVP